MAEQFDYQIVDAYLQPKVEQEPVKLVKYNCICGRTMKFESDQGVVAPKREWVGLTDEDDIDWEEGGNLKDLVKAIEAKLKEKNGTKLQRFCFRFNNLRFDGP